MTIHINGAGISGPAAALALCHAGIHATVHDTRPAEDIKSYGVIGITEENCSRLARLGCDLTAVALDNMYHEWTTDGMMTFRMSTQKFVQWTDAHRVLVDAAESHGATFNYGSAAGYAGALVEASGLRYASHRGLHADYRYVVYRGLSPINTDFAWLSLNDPGHRFSFKLAHSPIGASWELYVHRDNVARYSQAEPYLPRECELLPSVFRDVIDVTAELATSPISDWQVPDRMWHDGRLTIGDANGGMRPHTGMGANLGIKEALNVPNLIFGEDDTNHIAERQEWRERGQHIGKQVMGL